MGTPWTAEQLAVLESAPELRIATVRADGSDRRAVPIWVVRVADEVYVRSWHRRTTGWFGDVLTSSRARISVPRLEVDVVVDDVGAGSPALRAEVDAAYREKYGSGAGSMVTDEAATTTLRLSLL